MTAVDTYADLVAAVAGPVLRPDDARYGQEVSGFNLAFTHSPDVVVSATGAADVAAAVRWAREHRVPVSVQATGHGANAPIDRGLLISTRQMKDVRIDPVARSATVGAGVKWQRLLAESLPHGLVGLHGSSADVGVVGYTLGGGLPILGRRYGYAADRVRSVELVTGDGRVHYVDAQTEPDLFWAVRGGKATAGIVTSMTFELVPMDVLYGGGIFYPGEYAETVLRAFADWAPTMPDAMCASLAFLRLPPFPEVPEPLRGRFVMHLRVAAPVRRAVGDNLLFRMRAAAPAMIDTVAEMDYAAVDSIYQDPDHPVPASESCVLLHSLPPAAIDALLAFAGPGSDCPLLMVEVRQMAGALARPPAAPDAICARDAAFLVGGIGIAAGPHAAAVPSAHAGLRTVLAPFSTGRTMVNLHGTPGDQADRARAWSPDTYERLRRIKAAHDPADLFRFGHAVAPAVG